MVPKSVAGKELIQESIIRSSWVLCEVLNELVGAWWEVNIICLILHGNVTVLWDINLGKDTKFNIYSTAWFYFQICCGNIQFCWVDAVYNITAKGVRKCPAKDDFLRP